MNKKSGVVAFAFGKPQSLASNEFISYIARVKARAMNAPIYTQSDVPVPADFEFGVEFIQEEKGKPPPTLRIARGAVVWAKRLELDNFLIVAAKPHLWRCLRDLQAAVCEAGMNIDIECCKMIDPIPDYVWFCQDSTQMRTRSAKSWERRERILRMLSFFIYKMICS